MAGKIDLAIAAIDYWPRDDRLAWRAAVSDAGFFGESGKLAHQSPERLKSLACAYGRWISFLDHYAPGHTSGLDWGEDRTAVAGFLNRLKPLAPCSVRAYLTDLFTACQALAPDRDFALLHTIMRHQWRTARPVSDKRAKMVPARDLYQLAVDLMTEAPACSTSLRQASQYRDGLMIAMLITCPVRIGNFLAIELGRHLVFDGGHYRLRFEGSEVKNRRALTYRIPSAIAPYIDRWLGDYRPICLVQRGRHYSDDGGSAFWVTSGGGRYRNTGHIRSRIEQATALRFGNAINPHLFRDIAATTIASEIPHDVAIIRDVLGHSNLRTGEQFYNQASSLQAATQFHAMLDHFRVAPDNAVTP